jgi:hypothetical protein
MNQSKDTEYELIQDSVNQMSMQSINKMEDMLSSTYQSLNLNQLSCERKDNVLFGRGMDDDVTIHLDNLSMIKHKSP